VGVAVHRLLGTVYGMTTALLVRRGRRPVPAGLAVGAVAFAVVDEGMSLPLATSYPLVSHLRGAVGHATVGLTIGVLLALLEPGRVSRRRA
jgi:MFS superfamily sulfate permease-like transporter